MQRKLRHIFIEVIWIAVSSGLSFLLSLFLFGKNSLTGTVDIHLYDTYFVFGYFYIFLPVFLLLTFIIYFIKEFGNSFRRTLPNWILIIIGLILVISLTSLTKIFSQFSTGSWTLYPPLSSLGSDKVPEFTKDPITEFITNIIIALQALIFTMLLFVTFRWGTQRRRDK